MTKEEFGAFVEDLYKFGILSDKDKSNLGYGDDVSPLSQPAADSSP